MECDKRRCKMCKNIYAPKTTNQLFCSEDCNRKHYKHTHPPKQRVKYTKTCKECGHRFETYIPNKIYCDKVCLKKAQSVGYTEKKKSSVYYHIMARDEFRCAYCGRTSYGDSVKLVLDHIHPKKKQGLDTSGNLITSCDNCNGCKSYRLLDIEDKLLEEVSKRNKKYKLNGNEVVKFS